MSTQKTMVTVRVQRYRPEEDSAPWWQSFDIAFRNDLSILDVLHLIKEEHDSSLAYRWSCRMAICGSCGYMVNGVPKLGCHTYLRDYIDANGGTNEVTIAALANFPIERDLIATMDDFIEKLEAVKPYIINSQPPAPDQANIQTPEQVASYADLSLCINCGLCYAACPQYGLNNEFFGPAALALLQRYNKDSRDNGQPERMPVLNSEQGVWSCTFVGECSTVCPKGVDPARAINAAKIESAADYGLNLIGLAQQKTEVAE